MRARSVCERANTVTAALHNSKVYCGRQCTVVLLGSRYMLVLENKNWYEAHVHCIVHYNAKLVIIANLIDQLRLQQYLETFDGQRLCCLVYSAVR